MLQLHSSTLQQVHPRRAEPRRPSTRLGAKKKENTPDDSFTSRPWFGAGYLNETSQDDKGNYITRLQSKKVLSSVERAGVLSALDRSGLSLAQIERLGLLSTAERLGLLSAAERLLNTDPSVVTSLSIPFLVGTILTLVVLPDDNPFLAVGKYGVAAALAGVSLAFFVGGFLLAGLAEED